MSKTIVVTGGAGFIGSHTVNLLLKNGYKVDVVDIFREGKNNIIKHENVSYHEVDIRNKNMLLEVFEKTQPDAVIHFAALAIVPESMAIPAEYYDTNLVGGFNLLECMRVTKVSKIIFSSSSAVYGEPQAEELDESHQKNPTNTYGYTKLVFENMLKDYHRSYNVSSIALRYFCAAGCDYKSGLGEWHTPETHIIPSIIETLLCKRKEFFVFGNDFATHDGTGVRDYIHVSDLASAHVCALTKLFNEPDVCEHYNLGINKGYSVMDLIAAAEKVAQQKLNYSIRERRPGDPSRLIANSNKAQKELGWKPEHVAIADIIDSTYQFMKNTKFA